MAKATLPTNYQDDVLKSTMGGKRRYTFTDNSDGTKSLEDATQYDKVGSNFGAADMNKTNAAVNAAADASKIIDSLSTIASTTQAGYMAGALAVKELNQNLVSLTERLTYIEGTLTSSTQYFNYPSGFNYDNSVAISLCYRKDQNGRQLSTNEITLRASDIKVSRVIEPDVWQGKFVILLYRYR